MMENLRRACEKATSEKLGGYYHIWRYVAIMAQVYIFYLHSGHPEQDFFKFTFKGNRVTETDCALVALTVMMNASERITGI